MVVSKDIQEEIIAALMKNSYLFSICKDEMTDGYFSDLSCKVIYKALSVYYKKYNSIPGLNELLIMIDEVYYPSVGVQLSEVKDTCCKLFEYAEVDEAFIKDKITDFLRKVRSSSALKDFLDKMKSNPNLESDSIVSDLAKALDVQLSSTRVFMMNNIDQVKEARNAAVGSGDQSKIIHSFIESLNSSLMFGGWQPSTVNMVVAPPGCFVGDTKVMTIDGECHTLEELYSNKVAPGVYGSDEQGNIKVGLSQEVYLSEYTKELVDVEIDNQYHIRCTPDHPFMMRDGTYKQAKDLQTWDELMPMSRDLKPINNSKDCESLYEVVINGNNDYWYTHKLSYENIEDHNKYSVIHHKDRNRRNNYPSNLEGFNDISSHSSYHYHHGDYNNFIENGKRTRITSERVRIQNLANWKDDNYRNRMRKISQINGQNSVLVNQLNYDSEFQAKTRKGKVLSFINRLFLEFPGKKITRENYEDFVRGSSAKRKIWLSGIDREFNCSWEDLMILARNYNHKVTNITRITLESEVPVYGIVDAKPFNNYAIALNDNEGVFVSNTGKSMFLINEGANAAKQGFDVLHIFIGDMVEYDGFIRYLSCISGMPQNSLVMMSSEKQQDIIKVCNQQYNDIFNRIFILAYPSLSLDVNSLIEDINKFEKQLEKDFGMIIIDYPDNLLQEGRSLYEDGGTLYSSLERLSRLSKSVVLVASQPQRCYWQHEIIPLEGAAESSKKQMAVDVMLTMNTTFRGSSVGSILLAKARKGTVGKIFRVNTDYSKCHLEEIDEAKYQAIKAASGIK